MPRGDGVVFTSRVPVRKKGVGGPAVRDAWDGFGDSGCPPGLVKALRDSGKLNRSKQWGKFESGDGAPYKPDAPPARSLPVGAGSLRRLFAFPMAWNNLGPELTQGDG